MKYAIGAILAAVLLTACSPEPTMSMYKGQPETAFQRQPVTYSAPNANIPRQEITITPERFTVVQVGIFRDELAYGSRRGIYVITDRKTGKEFFGVSGVGISETGSHSNGKTSTSDER